MVELSGRVDDGYGAVADAFRGNFDRYGEVGAACAVIVGGVPVVDIWAGVADPRAGRAWAEDTLQMVFSTTKGATAICAALLVERGELDLAAPVASYWPEFAAAGKGAIPVRWLLTHQAGLVSVDTPLTADQVLAVTPVVDALAAQAPMWEPGTAHGYHALTYGWLVGEVVRRVSGRTLGRFFADEVAAPLGLDFWIGLPEALEARVAPLLSAPAPTDPLVIEAMLKVAGYGTVGWRALSLDGAFPLAGPNGFSWNTRAAHASEVPAANGITNARSLARMYAGTIGEVNGVRLLSTATVDAARAVATAGLDRALQVDSRFGFGFMLESPSNPLLSDRSFGHPGAGGSLGFADPEAGVGFGYVMNQMGGGVTGDPRNIALVGALRTCLS